jgi:hypothetical protein
MKRCFLLNSVVAAAAVGFAIGMFRRYFSLSSAGILAVVALLFVCFVLASSLTLPRSDGGDILLRSVLSAVCWMITVVGVCWAIWMWWLFNHFVT